MNTPLINFEASRIRRQKGVKFREVGDEIFLVHPDGEQIHNLNSMAAALWRLLGQPITGQEMANVVQTAFPIMAMTKVEEDVKRILTELLERGFVHVK